MDDPSRKRPKQHLKLQLSASPPKVKPAFVYKGLIRKVFIQIRSKYDFSMNTFNLMKINQLANPKSVLHFKFIELLLAIDCGEFFIKYYPTDLTKQLLPEVTLSYSMHYDFVPNYLPLEDISSMITHWLNLKQKGTYDNSAQWNNLKSDSNDNKSFNKALDKFRLSIDSLKDDSKDKAAVNKGFQRRQSLAFAPTQNKESPVQFNRANDKQLQRDSIDSIVNFAHLIDNIENAAIANKVKPLKGYATIIPKKKYKTKRLYTPRSSVLDVISSREADAPSDIDKTAKTVKAKHGLSLSKRQLLVNKSSIAFVPTHVFFDKMKLKEKSDFSFSPKHTREMERGLLNIRATISLSKPTSPSSKTREAFIRESVLRKMTKHTASMPFLNSIHYKPRMNNLNLLMDTINMNRWKGVKHSKGFCESSNCSNSLIPSTCLSSPIKKKVEKRYKGIANSSKQSMSNINMFKPKLKVTIDSFAVTSFSISKKHIH